MLKSVFATQFFCSSGLPGGSEGKKSACAGRPGFGLWVLGSPGGGNGLPTPVFSAGEPRGQRSLSGLQSMESQGEPDMAGD